jgi:short-subunit dehydrogenase
MKELRGRTALVTGASRGIGIYIARALAREGMDLVLAARSAESLEKVAADLATSDQRVQCVPTDVGDRSSLQHLVDEALAIGGVDVLVNNAGIDQNFAYDRVPQSVIDDGIEVNLRAPMFLTRQLMPQMLERGAGHIVSIASVAGLVGTPYNETYSATKFGLIGFAQSLRATAIGEGWPIGVSTICPGFVTGAGMYEDMKKDHGVEASAMLGTVSAEQVAQDVVRSIVDEVPEIVSNSRPIRPLAIIGGIFPGTLEWFGQKTGVIDLFKGVAEKRERELTKS